MLGLTACGGGGSGPSVVLLDGVFKDSNVSGLSYESGGKNGVTGTKGEFKYEEGADVKFSIGGVELGSGIGKAVMTPIDLVTDGTLATPEVINKVRFLMMLDENNDADDGIEISKEVQAIAADWDDVDFNADDFPYNQALTNIISDVSREDDRRTEFGSAEKAVAHLRSTLLCAFAGAFKGTYTGSESGNIVFVVNPVTGEVNGSSYNPNNEGLVEIRSADAINYDDGLEFSAVEVEASAKKFNGVLQSADDIGGKWLNLSDDSLSGAFTAERFGSNSGSSFRYVASFVSNRGDDRGIFTFNIDAEDIVSGKTFSLNTGVESNLSGTLVRAENKLTAKSDSDTDSVYEITGFIDPVTKAFTSGGWINGPSSSTGSFVGGGCTLN